MPKHSIHAALPHHFHLPRIGTLILTLVLVAGAAVSLGVTPASRVVATGSPGQELIQIPLRWCAVEGSPAEANPASLDEPDTDNVLWRRHERASDRIWIREADITFRSAFTALIRDQAEFPIIADPNPPPAQGGTGAGQLGDIEQVPGQPNTQEFNDALASCQQAWQNIALPNNTNLNGPFAVNLRQFVDATGAATTLLGRAGNAPITPADRCLTPPNYTSAQGGSVMVVDFTFTRSFDPDERTLAHELGHVLNIWHGNGLDDDGDTQYDQVCDPDENVDAPPASLMHRIINLGTNTLTQLQRDTTRGVAIAYVGATIDPPMELEDGDARGDQRVDVVHDVSEESVDLVWASLTHNTTTTELSVVALSLYGLIPRDTPPTQYLAFFDLDADPTTGGRPSDLGFPTRFEGAELAVQAMVEPPRDDAEPLEARGTVWGFDGVDWGEVGSVRADVQTIVDGELMPLNHVITIELPFGSGGTPRDVVRMQAIAEQLDGPRAFDVLPGGTEIPTDLGAPLFLVPPVYPVCTVTPTIARPGDTVTVEVAGLLPNRSAHVVLGDLLVADGDLDDDGAAAITFVIPEDSSLGVRLVTVGVDELALTADCAVDVFVDIDAQRAATLPEATPAVSRRRD